MIAFLIISSLRINVSNQSLREKNSFFFNAKTEIAFKFLIASRSNPIKRNLHFLSLFQWYASLFVAHRRIIIKLNSQAYYREAIFYVISYYFEFYRIRLWPPIILFHRFLNFFLSHFQSEDNWRWWWKVFFSFKKIF